MSEKDLQQLSDLEMKPESNTDNAENQETEKSEEISVFNLETFQKQLSRLDGKKQKTLIKLTNSPDIAGPSWEKDNVGDDMKKKEQNITCECEPSVTGAAVPTVISFIDSLSENSKTSQSALHVTDSKIRDETGPNRKSKIFLQSEIPKIDRSNAKIMKKSTVFFLL